MKCIYLYMYMYEKNLDRPQPFDVLIMRSIIKRSSLAKSRSPTPPTSIFATTTTTTSTSDPMVNSFKRVRFYDPQFPIALQGK